METPKGLIIVMHESFRQITEEEVLAELPVGFGSIPRIPLRLSHDLPMEIAAHVHWESFKAKQAEWYKKELEPAMEAHPDYRIMYFGLTHIPLAMHLGYLVGDTRKVEVFQCGYESKSWKWAKESGSGNPLDWRVEGLPTDMIGGETEAVLRYGVYAPIAPIDTKEVVADATKEVDVQLQTAVLDCLESPQQLATAVEHYQVAVQSLSSMMRGLNGIHLFASVPTGLAFLMGQQISPNRHPWVYIYHYKRTESPRYKLAMVLQEEATNSLVVPKEDRDKIGELRDEMRIHLDESIKRFVKGLSVQNSHWLPSIFPMESVNVFRTSLWDGLEPLQATIIKSTTVADQAFPDNPDRFYLDRTWYFSDELLYALHSRLKDKRSVLRALRLFIFHEAIHFKSHGMTSDTSMGIGRYPKIVETLDYQADVYALLHEYAYTTENEKSPDPKRVFCEAIDFMLETMWSFDTFSSPGSMQMRRINRYLIWYYLYLRIESDDCEGLEDILEILGTKPDLEIKGLKAVADPEGRLIARFSGHQLHDLGIATIYRNHLKRMGFEYGGLPLDELIEGFKKRDGKLIKSALRNFVAHVVG